MLKNKDLLTILIRLSLGYIFFSAGVCKLTHGEFGQVIGPPWLEESLAKYGLGLFAQVVAVSQVICGTLLLSQRFSLLGAVMLVPMNVAILAVTVSMQWVGTPFVNTFFLGLNLVLLGLEHRKFSFLFQPNHQHLIQPVTTDAIGQDNYSWLGIGFSIFTILMTFVSITLTNIAALLVFASFATTILRSGLLTKLDIALILLPFMGMVAITYADLNTLITKFIVGFAVAEALLLSYRLYLGKTKNTAQDLTATIASS
ncbi:DoxX family membrane protein [Pontibacter fetidus]|uniref:DoxX family membrane protein n=1 Tax=Pontibacter fetidus TaxID=2700082 RepID=A0A6B2H892_9BACT|nr:DoxX family membrane protein [Pontibacter fetidus]NDK55582.1 DoxX family membrane protein [Pontibacter fetidus]